MSAFTLLGKIGLDTTGFTRGLAGMKNAAGPAAKQIGDQVKGALLGAVGAGALVGTFKATLQKAFEIRKESARVGIDTEEYQTLKTIADQTGESLDVLAEKLRVSKLEGSNFAAGVRDAADELLSVGQIIDSGQIDRLAETFEKLQSVVAKFAPLVAMLADAFNSFMEGGTRTFEHIMGTFMEGRGRASGDAAMMQAGMEIRAGADNPQQADKPSSAVIDLRRKIQEEREWNQWWKDIGGDEASKGKTEKEAPKMPFKPSVSSLTQVGGYMSGVALNRRTVDKDVSDIKRLVDSLVSMTRQKE